MLANYRSVFALRDFRRFWIGASLSMFGDSMTRTTFIWFVYERTNSAAALGILMIFYTGPVLVGGLVAGWALDRFDRRTVIIVDCIVRGSAIALVPLFHWLGILALWHVYAAAAVYGLLMMVSLAGIPAMIPALVTQEQLNTANALEIMAYTVSGIAGPALAGVLIAAIGAPATVLLDVASYFLFAYAIAGMGARLVTAAPVRSIAPQGLSAAIRLLIGNPVLCSITSMFVVFNIGMGALNVWLPIYVQVDLAGGSALYGLLLAVTALGESASALGLGALGGNRSLGFKIIAAQTLAGLSVALIALVPGPLSAAMGLFLVGFFDSPLTIWAQTLRMAIIPPELRGRVFALIRLSIQGFGPVGSALAGFLLPLLGMGSAIMLSAAAIGLPGLAGLAIAPLRRAHGPAPDRSQAIRVEA
jgi:MFS family permease